MNHFEKLGRTVACVAGLAVAVSWPAFGADGRPAPGPRQAARAFRLDPGLTVELVAAEPEISSPVAAAFDERGRLWVVEMRDYPNGPAPGTPPQGRIKILEDPDGDGRYGDPRVFADGLLFANGVLPWKGGAIVTAAPHILMLHDDDRDGKADRREVLYEGFAESNPQLRVSHPVLGQDGWVYVANGLRGGKARRAGKPDGEVFDLSGRDFKFDLVHDRAATVAGMGQYGNTFDDWGHRFVCTNRNHLVPIVLEDRYARRNPFLGGLGPRSDNQAAGGAARTFPLSRNRTTSPLHAGTFSAACGVTVYRGTLLPELYQGCAFTCDPTGNLIHMERLVPDGASFVGQRVREGVEFFASPDDTFRPVSLTQGFDGALYVVDMNRTVIEHPEFMPPEEKSRPDLTEGKERGRIWRVVPEGSRPVVPKPRLDQAGTAELVGLLQHADSWTRTTAQRLLLERQDPAAVPALRASAASGRPVGRSLAAWLLDSFGALDEATVAGLLSDEEPRLREQGILLAEPRIAESPTLRQAVIDRAKDDDARVRFQAALSLGGWDDDRTIPPLATVAMAGLEDRWTRLAVATAVPTRAGMLIRALLDPPHRLAASVTPDRLATLGEFMALVGARRDPSEVAATLDALLSLDSTNAREPERWQSTGLSRLAEGMGRRGTRLSAFLAALPDAEARSKRLSALFDRAAKVAAGPDHDSDERLEALDLLAHAPWEIAEATLSRMLTADPSQEIRIAAARSLSAHARPEVAGRLLNAWRAATPGVRRELATALTTLPDRVGALLDAIEAGVVNAREIDPTMARRLTAGGPAELRERARKLLAAAVPEARLAVLERYQAALETPGDPKRGREVFRKLCATCHVLEGFGTVVGPDVSDTRVKTPAQLLGDVLNPNAAIDGNYVSYTVATTDGRVLNGLIAEETAASLTLKRAEGQTDVVLRQDVEAIQSDGVSLMPEGMEKEIDVGQMADLITYLKTWRDLDDTPRPGR